MDSLKLDLVDIIRLEYQKKQSILQPKIKKVFTWDLSRVKDYLVNREGLDSEDASDRIIEYRKFICLSLLNKKPKPISTYIDIVWHTHILFTFDYVKMSEDIFGKYFHHNPTVNDSESGNLSEEYHKNTLTTYKVMFGTPNEKYWPQNSQVCLESVCSDDPYPDPPEQKSRVVLS